MKLVKKTLPLISLPIVAAMPFAASSCSNVYIDLLNKQYIPSDITPLDAQELSASQAETEYYKYFKDKKSVLFSDALWGTSYYARTIFPTDNPLSRFETFLSHIYSFDIQEDTSGWHKISYVLKTQVQVRDDTELVGKHSYSINTYDIKFEMHNIAVYFMFTNEYTDKNNDTKQVWTLMPIKYNLARGRWYQELEGDESIKFEIKAVYKGYSETGAQNYVREVSESAIIDETHKYTPELNDVYTELMLFTPYYLSNAKPRMFITEDGFPTTIDSNYSTIFEFGFGSDTQAKEDRQIVKLTPLSQTYIYSPTGSGATVKSIEPENVSVTAKQQAKVDFEFNGTPNNGDIVYYCIEAEHPADEKTGEPQWFEWFTVSSIIKK